MLVFYFGCLFVISLFCEAELVTKCDSDEFPCNDGSCVEKDRWCDSRLDCNDDSDELYCYLRTSSGFNKNPNRCNETLFFLCNDGQCIPAIGRCDGYSSCYDNSDEEHCDAAENAFSVSPSWASQVQIRATEESLTVNGSDFKTSSSSHKNLMQADSIEVVIRNSTISVNESSNTSESLSSPVLKQMDHAVFTDNLSANISENETNAENLKMTPQTFSASHQALDFRSLLGGILNTSRNEQNTSTNNLNLGTSLNSASFNESSNKNLDAPRVVTSEFFSDQGNQKGHSEINSAKRNLSQSIANKEENLEKGYENLNPVHFRKSKERAWQWLISSRDSDYGWGDETARALSALYMSDYSALKPNEKLLMRKQLHLKLFALLSRNETERIPLGDLALYINALSASCDNPKNFYGHDLINILRHRTDTAQETSKLVTPFVYLVLCLNKDSSHEDVEKVQEMLHNTNISKIDSEAVMSLAATCISRNKEFSNAQLGQIAAKRLYRKVMAKGLPTNIYELALVTQALNEARVNQNLWSRTEAMRRIAQSQGEDGSFGDTLSTYYALPILSGKSFLWIGKDCPNKNTDFIPLEILNNGKKEMFVHYSLRFGNPVRMSQSLMIEVQNNTSFMDIMRIAAAISPAYGFKHDLSEGKPFVYSIGGTANDAERGLYWTPYTLKNSNEWTPFVGDIRNFIPVYGEYISFWMKPLF